MMLPRKHPSGAFKRNKAKIKKNNEQKGQCSIFQFVNNPDGNEVVEDGEQHKEEQHQVLGLGSGENNDEVSGSGEFPNNDSDIQIVTVTQGEIQENVNVDIEEPIINESSDNNSEKDSDECVSEEDEVISLVQGLKLKPESCDRKEANRLLLDIGDCPEKPTAKELEEMVVRGINPLPQNLPRDSAGKKFPESLLVTSKKNGEINKKTYFTSDK